MKDNELPEDKPALLMYHGQCDHKALHDLADNSDIFNEATHIWMEVNNSLSPGTAEIRALSKEEHQMRLSQQTPETIAVAEAMRTGGFNQINDLKNGKGSR